MRTNRRSTHRLATVVIMIGLTALLVYGTMRGAGQDSAGF